MSGPAYATVEQIAKALDVNHTAYASDTLRRLTLSMSRQIETRMRRHFYPKTESVTFTNPRIESPDRVTNAGYWLNRDLISLSTVTQDGTSLTVGSLELYPTEYGPPYSWLGVTGSTIIVAGDWGYSNDTETAGALAEGLDDSETGVDVTDSSLIGIGDLIIVGTERMIVTAKTMLDTAQNTSGALTADVTDQAVTVSDGTAYAVGETILIGSERMLILDIAGNVLTVERAFDGSTLAAHSTAADVYAPRTLTVERGAAGSTAASHLTAAAITRNVPPGPIVELCIGEVLHTFEQQRSGMARVVGSAENMREARGVGLADVRREANRYRRLRMAATG